MPYLPPINGVAFSQAYAEAMAVAPLRRAMLETLELRHSGFKNEDGSLFVPRIVRDDKSLFATLEATAPANPGETVEFSPLPFECSGLDETDTGVAPALVLAIDGVSQLLVRQLDYALDGIEPVLVTFRIFASDNAGEPATSVVPTMTLREVVVSDTRVTAKAIFNDPSNRGFPRREYSTGLYPGLTAR